MTNQQITAFVTGANRGLGKQFAAQLVERGAKVYAAARRPETIDLPGVVPVQLDITDPESIARAASLAGDVNVLINNAGVSTGASLLTGPVDDVRLEMETHYFGTLSVTRAFAPIVEANGGGSILNVLSVLSWAPCSRLRCLFGGEGGSVGDDRCHPAGARASWHPRRGIACRLHGHRHGRLRPRRSEGSIPPWSPNSHWTACSPVSRRSSPTSCRAPSRRSYLQRDLCAIRALSEQCARLHRSRTTMIEVEPQPRIDTLVRLPGARAPDRVRDDSTTECPG